MSVIRLFNWKRELERVHVFFFAYVEELTVNEGSNVLNSLTATIPLYSFISGHRTGKLHGSHMKAV